MWLEYDCLAIKQGTIIKSFNLNVIGLQVKVSLKIFSMAFKEVFSFRIGEVTVGSQ